MELPLPLQSYQTRSKPLSSQRLLNLFIENSGDPNVKNTMLFGAPGLKHYYDLPGAIRPQLGIISLKGYLVIADQDAIRIVRAEQLGGFSVNTTPWGELGMTSPTSHVQMVSNGNDILMLNSEAGRLVIATGTNDGDWTVQEPDTQHGYDPNTQKYTSISHITGVFVATAQIAGAAYVKYGNVLDPNSWEYIITEAIRVYIICLINVNIFTFLIQFPCTFLDTLFYSYLMTMFMYFMKWITGVKKLV